MSRAVAVLVLCSLVLGVIGAHAAPGRGDAASGEVVTQRAYDAQGRIVWERGLLADEEGIGFDRFYRHADPVKPDNPGQGKGGGGNGDGSDPATDCDSDKFAATGWSWSTPYAAYASDHAAVFDAAAQTWEDAAGADIFAGVIAGRPGVAGVYDGENQFDFVDLGSGGTIAVTTTWYYTSSGQAVESDARYNTHYAWGTSGAGGEMDVQNIATHEIGHTFGLDHPNGPPHKIGCLTMYAYGSAGETAKRSLGDGDILGIQALYG